MTSQPQSLSPDRSKNQSRVAFSWMAALASKMATLADLELTQWGGCTKNNYFALDYQPPIFLDQGGDIPIAFCAKVRFINSEGQTVAQFYWLAGRVDVADLRELPDQSAILTQIAYQFIRGMRSKITQLNRAQFVALAHNEGLSLTTKASGQRIRI